MMTSSGVIMPRSPWLASPGCTKKAGVPVEARVAAILRATWPDLPMPVTMTRPLDGADQVDRGDEAAARGRRGSRRRAPRCRRPRSRACATPIRSANGPVLAWCCLEGSASPCSVELSSSDISVGIAPNRRSGEQADQPPAGNNPMRRELQLCCIDCVFACLSVVLKGVGQVPPLTCLALDPHRNAAPRRKLRRGGAGSERPVLKTRGVTHGELMTRLSRLTRRQWLIVIHDLLATAAALLCTLFIRFEDAQLAERLRWIPSC